MDAIGVSIVSWLIIFTGTLAITSGLIWVSFKLLTFILKSLGYWKDTVYIMYLYYAIRRNDKVIKFKGKTYRLEQSENEQTS